MDRYPNLRTVIKAEFGSVYKFCKASGIPPATVKTLILGGLKPRAEANAAKRVEAALNALRPQLSMEGLWVRQEPQRRQSQVIEIPPGAKRLRVDIAVILSFE